MATHSSILAWEIPWTEEPGELQSMGLQSDMTSTTQMLSVCPRTPSGSKRISELWEEVRVLPVPLQSGHTDFEPHFRVFLSYAGPAPKELLGTRATFLLTQDRQGNGWSASDFTVHANSLDVSLFTPPSAVIGSYSLKMEISQGPSHSTTHPLGTFILLFNPWSAGITCSQVVMLTDPLGTLCEGLLSKSRR